MHSDWILPSHYHNIPLNPAICHTDPIGIFSYHNDLYAFLDSIPELPQAFICASDYIALYLTEHPERIPNGIILTGFDGSNEYTNINGLLTTAYVHTSLLGKRLSLQIIYRMDHPDAPFELTYISPEIVYRDSIVDWPFKFCSSSFIAMLSKVNRVVCYV